MAKYSVLIADDQPETNRPLFERLFHDDPAFKWHIAESRIEFSKLQLSDFDAVLLDVNLDDWGMTLKEAFEVIGGKCPVVLVSKYWDLAHTHKQIAEALADSKMLPFVGTLVLNDLGREGWESHSGSMRSQLRLAIARYRQQGLLEVGEGNKIRILHLSDPQYGDPGEDNLAFLVEKEIPRFVMGELGVDIHFIVITGDLTYSGQPKEYELAEKKLKNLVEAFLPNSDDWRERILIVPGNHDVDMRLAAADGVTYRFSDHKITCDNKNNTSETSHRSFALYPFRDFYWRLTGNPHSRDSVDLCWINDSFRHLGLRFYLLNSVAQIDCRQPKNAQIPIETLNKLVEGPSERDRLFGIALAHHGPPTEGEDVIESIANWPQVGKLIQNSPIRLFIHGHGHKRLAEIYPLADGNPRKPQGLMGESEVMRVMAPTTHLNNHKRPIGERRGFNLITLSRSHGDVEEIEVDSYELGEDKPHRAKGAPWKCRP